MLVLRQDAPRHGTVYLSAACNAGNLPQYLRPGSRRRGTVLYVSGAGADATPPCGLAPYIEALPPASVSSPPVSPPTGVALITASSEHFAGWPWRRRAAGFAALEPFLPIRYKLQDTSPTLPCPGLRLPEQLNFSHLQGILSVFTFCCHLLTFCQRPARCASPRSARVKKKEGRGKEETRSHRLSPPPCRYVRVAASLLLSTRLAIYLLSSASRSLSLTSSCSLLSR